MLLLGRSLAAEEAAGLGLVTEVLRGEPVVIPSLPGNLMEGVMERVGAMATLPKVPRKPPV